MASNDEVTHAWANQTGRARRSSNGNIFYDGDTIYSYGRHFAIARFVVTPGGERVCLLTTRTYSITTTGHTHRVWRAVHGVRVFRVPHVEESRHTDNARSYATQIEELLRKAKRARSHKDMLLRQADDLMQAMRGYVEAFQVQGFEHFNWTLDDIAEGAQAEREATAERERLAQLERDAERKRRYREETWPMVKQWLRGHIDDTWRYRSDRPLPRIEGDLVRTNWGASVPLVAAKRLYWRAVQCRRDQREEFYGRGGPRVGDFHLQRIKPNGDIVVGCHDIPFWFMRYAACRAGIPAEAPKALTAA